MADAHKAEDGDVAPGKIGEAERPSALIYVVGFVLALGLTCVSFWVAHSSGVIWQPSVPVALAVLAIAQMGVHLVFFLHLTSAPDNTNNILALALGVLIVGLVVIGSLWIMANLNHNMMPMDQVMRMQR